MITFYGHFTGLSSYPVVCKAIYDYLKVQKFDVQAVDLRSHPRTPNTENRTGVKLLFGFPEWHTVTPKHEINIGYHVCDVDIIPDLWTSVMNREDVIITPSVWCKSVFRKCGVTKPIHVVPHGVDRGFEDSNLDPVGPFTVLHFCSAKAPARKGTLELVRAFNETKLAKQGAKLLLIVQQESCLPELGAGVSVDVHLDGRTPTEQARQYQTANIVAVPSRAEGFGMIGLEALACGVPIIGTRCTGHKEWFGKFGGSVEVKTGPMDFCGGPGRAPLLDIASLKEALLYSCGQWDILREEAKKASCQVQKEFAWPKVLAPLAEVLEEAEGTSLS